MIRPAFTMAVLVLAVIVIGVSIETQKQYIIFPPIFSGQKLQDQLVEAANSSSNQSSIPSENPAVTIYPTIITASFATAVGVFTALYNKKTQDRIQTIQTQLNVQKEAKTLEREITDKYLIQLQYHATSLAYRLENLKYRGGRDYIDYVRRNNWNIKTLKAQSPSEITNLDHAPLTDEPKHITEYDSVTTLYALGTVLAFRKILLYGQIYSKIKDLYNNDNVQYVEQINASLEKIIDLLRLISKSDDVKNNPPLWFYYDGVLLQDLLTEEVQEGFRISSYEKFLKLYQEDITVRHSIEFTNIIDMFRKSEITLRLIIELIKLLNLLSTKTGIPLNIDRIHERIEKQIPKKAEMIKKEICSTEFTTKNDAVKHVIEKLRDFREEVRTYSENARSVSSSETFDKLLCSTENELISKKKQLTPEVQSYISEFENEVTQYRNRYSTELKTRMNTIDYRKAIFKNVRSKKMEDAGYVAGIDNNSIVIMRGSCKFKLPKEFVEYNGSEIYLNMELNQLYKYELH